MKRKKRNKSIVEIKIDRLAKAMDRGFTAVAEDIDDSRTELKVDIKKVDDRVVAVESKLGGIDNRIDNETFARTDLEVRVRKVLPNLLRSTERA